MARQGHPDAIATLMNRHLEAKGITAHVAQQNAVLQVVLEAALVPSQGELVPYVTKGITGLNLAHIQQLSISGKQRGDYSSAWSQDVVLPGGRAQPPITLQQPGEEHSEDHSITAGEDIGADLDALLASENYSTQTTPSPDPGALEADLGAILDGQPAHVAVPEDLLDFDLDAPNLSDQPENLDFEQLLSGTSPAEPQDLTLDFLLEDSPLSGEADLAGDFNLSQSSIPDTYLESSREDLSLDLDWVAQPAASLTSSPPDWQTHGLDLELQENGVPDNGAEADLDLSALFPDQPEESYAGLSDSVADLDPNISLWANSIDQDRSSETQPLAAEFQDLDAETFDPNLVLPSPEESLSSFGQDTGVDHAPEFAAASQSAPWSTPSETVAPIYDWPIEAEAVQHFEVDTLNIESDFAYGLADEGAIFPPGAQANGVDFDQTEELQGAMESIDLSFPDSEAEFVRLRDQSLPDLEDFDSVSIDAEPDLGLDLEEDGLDLPSIDFASAAPYYGAPSPSAGAQTNGFLYEANDADSVFPHGEEEEAADDFIHTFAPIADREVDQLSASTGRFRGWPKVLAGLGFGILALILAMMGLNTLRSLRTSTSAPVVLPQDGTAPGKPLQPESGDAFRDAVNAATAAANLTQTATTGAEWQAVADSWSQAITLMKQVPSTHPKYAVAQAKAVEYQTNLAYAQENRRRFP
jgi:hypothetical protein